MVLVGWIARMVMAVKAEKADCERRKREESAADAFFRLARKERLAHSHIKFHSCLVIFEILLFVRQIWRLKRFESPPIIF